MAHKLINNRVVVDWTTGDPEGDRIVLLSAYRDFISEISAHLETEGADCCSVLSDITSSFYKWHIDIGNQIDEVPRIWIKRPE